MSTQQPSVPLARLATSIFFGIEKENKMFEPLPAGAYIARCYSIIDLGTQTWSSAQYGEQIQRKIRLSFELPTELKKFSDDKGEQPIVISKEFTLSMHPKSGLRKFVESWLGKKLSKEDLNNFSEKDLIEKPCLLNIIHSQGEVKYANINSISPLMAGVKCPPQINPSVIFSLTAPLNEEIFKKLPEFIRKKIEMSPEYQAKLQFKNNQKPF